jgi:hypothetical protein
MGEGKIKFTRISVSAYTRSIAKTWILNTVTYSFDHPPDIILFKKLAVITAAKGWMAKV